MIILDNLAELIVSVTSFLSLFADYKFLISNIAAASIFWTSLQSIPMLIIASTAILYAYYIKVLKSHFKIGYVIAPAILIASFFVPNFFEFLEVSNIPVIINASLTLAMQLCAITMFFSQRVVKRADLIFNNSYLLSFALLTIYFYHGLNLIPPNLYYIEIANFKISSLAQIVNYKNELILLSSLMLTKIFANSHTLYIHPIFLTGPEHKEGKRSLLYRMLNIINLRVLFNVFLVTTLRLPLMLLMLSSPILFEINTRDSYKKVLFYISPLLISSLLAIYSPEILAARLGVFLVSSASIVASLYNFTNTKNLKAMWPVLTFLAIYLINIRRSELGIFDFFSKINSYELAPNFLQRDKSKIYSLIEDAIQSIPFLLNELFLQLEKVKEIRYFIKAKSLVQQFINHNIVTILQANFKQFFVFLWENANLFNIVLPLYITMFRHRFSVFLEQLVPNLFAHPLLTKTMGGLTYKYVNTRNMSSKQVSAMERNGTLMRDELGRHFSPMYSPPPQKIEGNAIDGSKITYQLLTRDKMQSLGGEDKIQQLINSGHLLYLSHRMPQGTFHYIAATQGTDKVLLAILRK